MDYNHRRNISDNRSVAELEYSQTAQEIAQEIVSQFPPSIFSADLRRLIVKAIDTERQQVKEWLSKRETEKE
jgi:hypothetical protein